MARDLEKEKQDKKGENIVHEFLERHFYNLTKNFNRYTDLEHQVNGIDTSFTIGGVEYKCDEKAAIDYRNYLKTFCLELSFLNRKNELTEGWLLNDNQQNNSYLFVWVDKTKNEQLTNECEILNAEIALVMKDDIFKYLEKNGWTKDKLRIKANNIRNNNDKSFGDIAENGLKFSFSKKLPEQPINVLLSRETYEKFPHTIYRKIKTYNNNERWM